MATYLKILKLNETYAIDNDKEPSAIKRLLLHHAHMEPHVFFSHLNDEMPKDDYKKFLKDVDCYIKHDKPVQHLIGHEEFFGYPFKVNEHVLIPRFETEELVAYVLDYIDTVFPKGAKVSVLDVGTGSGCIALTLAKENPNLVVTATDISHEALEVAKENAKTLNVDIRFLEGDCYAPIGDERFDVIVSNPPYIPTSEAVMPMVEKHEPHVALFGGTNGMDFYQTLLEEASKHLKPKAMMAFEHAYDKAKMMKKLIKKTLPKQRIEQKKDMQGKDRMTFVFID